jgi:hypothetical protein
MITDRLNLTSGCNVFSDFLGFWYGVFLGSSLKLLSTKNNTNALFLFSSISVNEVSTPEQAVIFLGS